MSDKQERRSVRRIDSFDRSILNSSIEHSLVVDIANEGAGLLILKEHSFFHDDVPEKCDIVSSNVHLNIFHPDIPLQDGADIEAKVIWVDHAYSNDHCKIGVNFTDMDNAQTDYVEKLEKWLSKDGNYFFHCELEKQ